MAYFQPTAVGKFMNNIRGIYVIHFPPVQCLSNVMRSGLAEYNTNLRVLYLKLIMHVRRGKKKANGAFLMHIIPCVNIDTQLH